MKNSAISARICLQIRKYCTHKLKKNNTVILFVNIHTILPCSMPRRRRQERKLDIFGTLMYSCLFIGALGWGLSALLNDPCTDTKLVMEKWKLAFDRMEECETSSVRHSAFFVNFTLPTVHGEIHFDRVGLVVIRDNAKVVWFTQLDDVHIQFPLLPNPSVRKSLDAMHGGDDESMFHLFHSRDTDNGRFQLRDYTINVGCGAMWTGERVSCMHIKARPSASFAISFVKGWTEPITHTETMHMISVEHVASADMKHGSSSPVHVFTRLEKHNDTANVMQITGTAFAHLVLHRSHANHFYELVPNSNVWEIGDAVVKECVIHRDSTSRGLEPHDAICNVTGTLLLGHAAALAYLRSVTF